MSFSGEGGVEQGNELQQAATKGAGAANALGKAFVQ
jgi:hypothetical protein